MADYNAITTKDMRRRLRSSTSVALKINTYMKVILECKTIYSGFFVSSFHLGNAFGLVVLSNAFYEYHFSGLSKDVYNASYEYHTAAQRLGKMQAGCLPHPQYIIIMSFF